MSAGAPIVVEPLGPFSLAASARFIAGWPPGATTQPHEPGTVRLAFALDSYEGHAGAVIREDDGVLSIRVTDESQAQAIARQVKRVLSLDHDARDLPRVVSGDPVVARAHRASGGLRPVLFNSPYEAAAWSILSARTHHRQAQDIRAEISRTVGATLDVDGVEMAAFPTPQQLLELQGLTGLGEEKMRRLRGVAEAALAGGLDPYRLRELGAPDALAELQAVRGIGPFYAGLILVRATGATDLLPPGAEPRLLGAVARAYDRGETITPAELEDIAEGWRPYRTWIAVLMRVAG